jgi:hypothetical protein
MSDEIKWSFIGLIGGLFFFFDWYKDRNNKNYRNHIIFIVGIFLICFSIGLIIKNLISLTLY